MKAKSILATLLLLVAGLQTAQAQRVVLKFQNGNAVQYNVTELRDIQFVEITAIDGHEYIDLGLPSGTLWATTNIGAENPEDYGYYYSWGETQTKDDYTANNYVYGNPIFGSGLTKYNADDGLMELLPEDDAATANWGSNWQMPSAAQCDELLCEDYTTVTPITNQEGKKGYLITSKINGNSIFLPLPGYMLDELYDAETSGCYYSRTQHSRYASDACVLYAYYSSKKNYVKLSSLNRNIGGSVRPVRYQETSYQWPVRSIELSETELSLAPSVTKQLSANVLPEYAVNKALAWESNDETVATVDETGIVTAVKPGTCTITCRATDGSGVSAECQVTVAFEYVDLGLPSGTLWAKCNVGANTQTEYGDYFAWGETKPKDVYDWTTYQYCNNSSDSQLTKYTSNELGYNGWGDDLEELLPEDDAATYNWGEGWRTPSREQFEELLNSEYTTCSLTTRNGVYGLLVRSNVNSNYIFLPAAGYYGYAGETVQYWSRNVLADVQYCNMAWFLGVIQDQIHMEYSYRCMGRSIRPVKEKYEYVEIGGLKWATMNVGATTVAGSYKTCSGDYFAWGETEPRYETITRTGANEATFTWKDGYAQGYSEDSYSNPPITLDAYNDAATANWGSSWRTPTHDEFFALFEACSGSNSDQQIPVKLTEPVTSGGIYWLEATQTFEPKYTGVVGVLFVSASDITKRVFFPVCGTINNTALYDGGKFCRYWSLPPDDRDGPYNCYLNSAYVYPSSWLFRPYYGHPVRPVSE